MTSKRRGKYRIEPVYEYVDGLDKNYEEILKEEKLIIQGRFSLEFWNKIQEKYKLGTFREVLEIFGGGVSLSKFRDMLYYSHLAWIEEVNSHTYFEPILKSPEHASQVAEQLGEEDKQAIFDALIGSQVISELMELAEKLESETSAKKQKA